MIHVSLFKNLCHTGGFRKPTLTTVLPQNTILRSEIREYQEEPNSHLDTTPPLEMPSITVMGLHPSFAPTIFLYWIGGQLTLNLGFYLLQDEWLSQKEWDDFCAKAKRIKEGVK